jgi:DNA-binding transcriptional MerR regulator
MPRSSKASPSSTVADVLDQDDAAFDMPATGSRGAGAVAPNPLGWTLDDVPSDEDDDNSHDLMGIAEVCAAFKVSPRALRFYETKELLAPKRINGARVYGKQDRARLARILRAKSLGTPLSEIKHYLDMYGRQGEGRLQQLTYVIEKTAAAIAELESKRAQIDASLDELRLINTTSREALEAKRRSSKGS